MFDASKLFSYTYRKSVISEKPERQGNLQAHSRQSHQNTRDTLPQNLMITQHPSQPYNDARLELSDHRACNRPSSINYIELRQVHQTSEYSTLQSINQPLLYPYSLSIKETTKSTYRKYRSPQRPRNSRNLRKRLHPRNNTQQDSRADRGLIE